MLDIQGINANIIPCDAHDMKTVRFGDFVIRKMQNIPYF